jgi:murein DD-endopeptidase MepM/ murein hydrolase activator NlpD
LSGTVVSAGYENGYGNTILIQHSGGLQTRYAHLGSMNVKTGDVVASQQMIGSVGDTGRSTGPHLHFEVIKMGKAIDPLLAKNQHVASLEYVSAASNKFDAAK